MTAVSLIHLWCHFFRREHFVLRGSPLKGLSKYSDIESHEKRYIEAVSIHTLNVDCCVCNVPFFCCY